MDQQIKQHIRAGALVVVNHSGGKDSQAMLIYLRRLVPAAQLVIVHASLGRIEWGGVTEHIVNTAAGLPVVGVSAKKTFFDMVRHRGKFPDSQRRQCTSDLKRDPIGTAIRRLCRVNEMPLVINCMGLRAAESPGRRKLAPVSVNKRLSRAGRVVLDWLPIHTFTTAQVFQTIARAGQSPHWAYQAGMSRLSCCFCILASRDDLRTAARLRPGLYAEYVALERELAHTLKMNGESLESVTGVPADLSLISTL